MLWVTACIQREVIDQPLAQVAARTLGKERVLGAQLHTGHVAIFRSAIGTDAHVANQDTANDTLFDDHFLSGEPWENLDAQRFCLLRKPAAQVARTDHVARQIAAGVVHAFRHERIGNLLRFVGIFEQVYIVANGRGRERRTTLFPVGKQLRQCARFKDGPRENVGADL